MNQSKLSDVENGFDKERIRWLVEKFVCSEKWKLGNSIEKALQNAIELIGDKNGKTNNANLYRS
jgi:hypothetical protein